MGNIIKYIHIDKFSYKNIFSISIIFFFLSINKITSGFLISILIFCYFYFSNYFKKNFFTFIILNLIFLIFLSFNENFSYLLDLFFKLISNKKDEFGLLNNHNLIDLLINNFKDLYFRSLNYDFFIFIYYV